jgi:hypothetical protein
MGVWLGECGPSPGSKVARGGQGSGKGLSGAEDTNAIFSVTLTADPGGRAEKGGVESRTQSLSSQLPPKGNMVA